MRYMVDVLSPPINCFCSSYFSFGSAISLDLILSLCSLLQAGNILIDSNGTVKLADFGVAACMFDTGDRQRSRNTFVGTPCW